MKRREFDLAERELSKAIDNGWVSADLLKEAYLERAQARIGFKKLDEAKTDLDWLQERATNLDSMWVVRGKWHREHRSEADAAKVFQTSS